MRGHEGMAVGESGRTYSSFSVGHNRPGLVLFSSELGTEGDLRRTKAEILNVECGDVCIELLDFHAEGGIQSGRGFLVRHLGWRKRLQGVLCDVLVGEQESFLD